MFSQFFVLSRRGDTIILRDYRGDTPREACEIFYRTISNAKSSLIAPIFNLDGINYFFIKQSGLYFVAVSRINLSPSFALELIVRIIKLFKDYCGTLNEEALRKNFVLAYELLEEVIDFGYPQVVLSEQLKPYIHEKPTIIEENTLIGLDLTKLTRIQSAPSNASNKSIIDSAKKSVFSQDEVFIDLVERLDVAFSSSGNVIKASVDGSLVVKSFLTGNPEIRLGLNEDLSIGKGQGGYGRVTLDDINFHQCVRLNMFETNKELIFSPPEGESTIFNYRVTQDIRLPFKIFPFIEEINGQRIDLLIKIRSDFPMDNTGVNVEVVIPVSKITSSVTFEFNQEQSNNNNQDITEFKLNEKVIIWQILKILPNSERFIRCKLSLASLPKNTIKKELGPVSLKFEIPMFTCSNLMIRGLSIIERGNNYSPSKWVRSFTQVRSYVSRIG
eukprot:TRINITY_DN1312_c0_g1_i1.p1 TRINITY_DN1312_c0_g1~~TRINITY_DN1312_c0_g1_i1.p1  ORF type:complete len:444 (-),score=165.00 TRINITY_DN1312_c0_g1_i1:131-1462(-)